MLRKQMMTKISSRIFLLIFLGMLMSCATHEVKRLEERDPLVKKLEERDSMRIIKKSIQVKKNSPPKKVNNN